ncbi:hypothetical protein G5I_12644 [Acromyrmex echinatior]|uniref:Uncharacterized protein n=1 Tax=Acromyrmex echinatior TaxID=103372 RepID=F4X2W2_ACREC|nr:hypothetical protein G5I_12644 [Acromyrmex echinatior]
MRIVRLLESRGTNARILQYGFNAFHRKYEQERVVSGHRGKHLPYNAASYSAILQRSSKEANRRQEENREEKANESEIPCGMRLVLSRAPPHLFFEDQWRKKDEDTVRVALAEENKKSKRSRQKWRVAFRSSAPTPSPLRKSTFPPLVNGICQHALAIAGDLNRQRGTAPWVILPRGARSLRTNVDTSTPAQEERGGSFRGSVDQSWGATPLIKLALKSQQ